MDPSSSISPKRKRGLPPIATIPPTPPTSSPPHMSPDTTFTSTFPLTAEEHDSGSPRTKVAYNFQGLQIEDERGHAEKKMKLQSQPAIRLKSGFDASQESEDTEDGEVSRKRAKFSIYKSDKQKEERLEIPETPGVRREGKAAIPESPFTRKIAKPRATPISKEKNFMVLIPAMDTDVLEKMKKAVSGIEIDPAVLHGKPKPKTAKFLEPPLSRAYPSINRLSDSKSRSKKRAGTPPLSTAMDIEGDGEDFGEGRIIDPERAALTWHDDEITGHNPDDPDDDGEGINGIGFRPTAAEAYARAQKRKQQMAEYRNREAKEARAKRSERRRGSELKEREEEAAENARRVRFMEEMPQVIETI